MCGWGYIRGETASASGVAVRRGAELKGQDTFMPTEQLVELFFDAMLP